MRWNVAPAIFEIGPFLGIGPIEIRWYGLFFATGILLGARALPRLFAGLGLNREDAERVIVWLVLGMIVGAHLLHLVFYEPRSFIDNPRRIIEIGVGLASHGGGLGAALALALYCRRGKLDFFRHADAAMIAALWVVPFVRIGNFFNSEIYGRPTDLPWGIIFEYRGQTVPRHPSQLYEALTGFALLVFAYWLYRRHSARLRSGATFLLLLGLYFLSRFLIEYVKAYQVLPSSFPLTMGQCLSLPVVIACGYLLLFTERFRLFRPRI